MTLWYFEEPVLGTWRPRTSSDQPTKPPRDGKDANGHCAWRSYHEARAALDAITQPQADALARVRTDAVKIKPLVWRFFDVDHSFGKGVYDANSIGHTYTIQDCGKRDFPMRFYVSAISASFAELSDAKAVAQADHEARIRAAIGGDDGNQP